ncbi:MAG TPA: YeeE/YedE thiosulfate transporter family protein, partial [Anaerolineales bacterium]|nr:YeeE/YedE thiosulfate transporter family protein [Anaerolineales bacterium]
MPIFPLPLETLLGKPLMYVLFGVIGFAFGYVLEISGFGDSTKLAAQFYFKELTVLKVMFTAIVVAMVLIFAMVGLGLLDYNQVWVNPTYLWSGILGGLIMGVGFIVGGFCPGTSLVSAATFKIDGAFFVLGGLFGIFLFGETEWLYDYWWNTSGFFGRLTIMDWLNLPTGVVVTLIVFMALFMFWGSEQLERLVGKRDLKREPRSRYVAAGALIAGTFAVSLIGQSTVEQKWSRLEP